MHLSLLRRERREESGRSGGRGERKGKEDKEGKPIIGALLFSFGVFTIKRSALCRGKRKS